jgi:hypothetical protein
MRIFNAKKLSAGIVLTTVLVASFATAHAQSTAPTIGQGPGSQGRDCQTVRTCNFARNAEVRGCLSSYTCRTCKFVPSNCRVGSTQGACQKLSCTWGG